MTNNDDLSVPGRPHNSRLWRFTVTIFLLTMVAAVVISLLPSGYLIDAPGNAIDTNALVTVPKDVRTYAHAGSFRMVTVSETSQPIFAQAIAGWLDKDSDVYPRQDVVGDTPQEAEIRYQAVLMQGAKLSAIYKAMRVLGLPVSMTGGGVFVDEIVKDSPAQGVLEIGDTIKAMNNTTVQTVDDIARFMSTAKVGESVTIVVDRLGVSSNMKLHLKLGKVVKSGKPNPFLGIYMETRPNYSFPFEVGFDTGEIGGPSAGLSLTLSLINKLSPDGLTRGNDIAVTGTINPDGSVGMIGGIRQKVAAVRNVHAAYFLVPAGNAADACAAIGDPYTPAQLKKQPVPCGSARTSVRIIPVLTLDDALAKVRALPAGAGH